MREDTESTGVMKCTFIHNTLEAEAERGHEFEASLGYVHSKCKAHLSFIISLCLKTKQYSKTHQTTTKEEGVWRTLQQR